MAYNYLLTYVFVEGKETVFIEYDTWSDKIDKILDRFEKRWRGELK